MPTFAFVQRHGLTTPTSLLFPPRTMTSHLISGQSSSEMFATFLDAVTMLDEDQRPFTAFVIEVKNGKSTWRINKRFQSFTALLHGLGGKTHPIVMPAAKPGATGNTDFVTEVLSGKPF